jgi:hypothetical protein
MSDETEKALRPDHHYDADDSEDSKISLFHEGSQVTCLLAASYHHALYYNRNTLGFSNFPL